MAEDKINFRDGAQTIPEKKYPVFYIYYERIDSPFYAGYLGDKQCVGQEEKIWARLWDEADQRIVYGE